MKYNLSNDTWGVEEQNAVRGVMESGHLTMGENVTHYEKAFAKKFGSSYAVMSNSGSSANLLAMAALLYSGRLKRGDEVLVTAVSWSTTYYPVYQMGFKLRFVDIDLETLNVDLNQLESAITPQTRAVLAVNLLGNPNDFLRLQSICDSHKLILLEDNCESMGASFHNRYAGTFGLIGSFSTYFSHHLCTMEGGMSVTDDEELYHFMLSIRSHGWTRNIPDDSPVYRKSEDPFFESFHFIMPGFNLRPIEMEAAAGMEQLKKLDAFIEKRRKNAETFKKVITEQTPFLMQKETGISSWFGFALILPEKYSGKRSVIVEKLRENGIEVRPVVAGNFVRQRAVEFLDYSIYGTLKNADYIHENGFFVGNHSLDMDDSIQFLADVLEDTVKMELS